MNWQKCIFVILLICSSPLFAECPFCSQTVLDKQQIYHNEHAIVLYNYKPAHTGHLMIIPKRHVEYSFELTQDEVLDIHQLLQKTNQVYRKHFGYTNFFVVQKNGENTGRSVEHVHYHTVPVSQYYLPVIKRIFNIEERPRLSDGQLLLFVTKYRNAFRT